MTRNSFLATRAPWAVALAAAIGIAGLAACGGGGGGSTPPPPPPSTIVVTVAAPSATLNIGESQTATATVTGTSNTAVTWRVSGAGSLSQGVVDRSLPASAWSGSSRKARRRRRQRTR